MPIHVVRLGECVSRIAEIHGIRDWTRIWNHERNDALKKDRKDPNQLFPEDRVFVPDHEPRAASYKTHQTHFISVKHEATKVRVVVQNTDGAPVAGRDVIYGTQHSKTAADGFVEFDFENAITLKVHMPVNAWQTEGVGWTIHFGLVPIDEPCADNGRLGALQRLENLGFYQRSKSEDAPLFRSYEDALKAFQKSQKGLSITGKLDDATRKRLKELGDGTRV